MFKLAHISDVHLGPLPCASIGQLLSKRIIGLMSWKFRRKGVHDMDVLNRVVTDIKQANVDHVAFSGDLINIALPEEFTRGQQWLYELGDSRHVSFVPGNHDAYVKFPWQDGLALWGDYMVGDLNMPGIRQEGNVAALFPYVRQRRNVAIIGVCSAIAARWNKAWGEVGQRQLQALEEILGKLHERGFYRVVMIHHPPLAELAPERKALRDGDDMKIVLEKAGAELVLHGHNHMHMRTVLETRTGSAQIIGVPSASARLSGKKPAAGWYQFDIARRSGVWTNNMTIRSFDPDSNKMVTQSQLCLDREG
jgi:3',5'-cyclic AMP phosphodiesterase CpdA